MKPLFPALALAAAGWCTAASATVPRDHGIERRAYTDPVTGVTVLELTAPDRPADNLYFHFSNFTADNRYLLLVAAEAGTRHLFRVEVESGRLVQLTDDPAITPASACPDPVEARRAYVLRGAEVLALDVETGAARRVGELPPPYQGGYLQLSPSGDGRWLATGRQRDAATWEIGRFDTTTGVYHPVLTQGFRLGHVQHHPSAPVLFYVWETGGYAPQRTWLVNTDGTGNRPFYAPTNPAEWLTPLKEWVTHEAWVAGTGEMSLVNDKLGLLLVNLEGRARLVREGRYWHTAASPDGTRLVADDFQGRLWLIRTATGEARLLASGLRETVRVHPHPSFDRRGHYVQFHTGRGHETVALIDLRTLPPAP